MAKPCSICVHPKRVEIDKDLILGVSARKISEKYEVSAWAIRNHQAKGHITRQLKRATELKTQRRDDSQALDLFTEVELLIERTKTILNRAESRNQDFLSLSAIAQLRSTYELLGKMLFAAKQEEADRTPPPVVQVDLSVFTEEELRVLRKFNIEQLRHYRGRSEDYTPTPAVRVTGLPSPSGGMRRKRRNEIVEDAQEDSQANDTPPAEPEEPALRVRPVEPTKIPSSKWKDLPENERQALLDGARRGMSGK